MSGVRALGAILLLGTALSVAGGTARSQPPAGPPPAAEAAARPVLAWRISETLDDMGNPHGTLALSVGNRTVPIRVNEPVSYSEISPGAWSVPVDAAIACLGWWAGRGEALYAVRGPAHIDVYLRAIEEEEAEETFRLVRRVPLDGP